MTSRRIRVLHVGKFYAPVEGGIENVVQELINSFQQDDEVEASVLVAQRRGPAASDRVQGASVRRVRSHGVLLGTPLAPGFPAETARMGRGFDVVHVHVPNPLPFFCDWQALGRDGARLMIHHHSDIVRPAQRMFLQCMRRQERQFYAAAQRVLVTSRSLLDHSETLAPYRGKCRVLPLSISLDGCPKSSPERRAAVRAELGFREEDTVFFFLGRLVYYKGVQDLLRAAARCRAKVQSGVQSRIQIMIGGAGPLRAKLGELAVELGLTEQVRFLGKIEQSRLSDIFSASDVFVLPSNEASEAFGVVQLEAMAYGLPVINTALPTGVPEVSLHGVSGITVPPRDPAALGEAMCLLAADRDLRLRYAEAASRRVQDFARPNITERLRFLYREVMDAPIKEVGARRSFSLRALPGVGSLTPGSKGEVPCSTRSWSIFPQR